MQVCIKVSVATVHQRGDIAPKAIKAILNKPVLCECVSVCVWGGGVAGGVRACVCVRACVDVCVRA